MPGPIPVPPLELAQRVGAIENSDDPFELYELLGRESHDQVVSMLPQDWDFVGKRVLDFGCGSGRTLRHFLDLTDQAEFWGCDIDAASIDWLNEHLSPPLHAFKNAPLPPISRPNGFFDLAYAISVFTHLTASWSEWLLELHRVLADGGLLIATYMGEGMSEWLTGEPWGESKVGMNVLRTWQDWDVGGPWVLHSDWWIEEHWGRAFEIVDVVDQPQMSGELGRHSWALLRKKEVDLTRADLEAFDERDRREIDAIRHNLAQTQSDTAKVIRERDAQLDDLSERLHASNRDLERAIHGYEGSLSWRATKPFRAFARQRASKPE